MSESCSMGLGARLTHSMASSSDFTCQDPETGDEFFRVFEWAFIHRAILAGEAHAHAFGAGL